MAVYQQLIEVRSQIEQIRTQLNSFDKLAAFSTINLELVPTEAARPVVASDEWRPGDYKPRGAPGRWWASCAGWWTRSSSR